MANWYADMQNKLSGATGAFRSAVDTALAPKPDITSAFLKGWKPTGNQYTDYTELTSNYGFSPEWVNMEYPSIQAQYNNWLNTNAATTTTTPGPLDAFIQDPTKYAATSTSGVPDDVAAALKDYMAKASSSLSGYQSVLNNMLNPSNFAAAYKPAYDEVVQKGINDLSSKGMINSTVAGDTLAKSGNAVTSQYLQRLLDIASQMGTASSLPISIANALQQSKSTNQAGAYETVYNILAGL